jgi:N-dimethylarginine dimethylaminohydrolase
MNHESRKREVPAFKKWLEEHGYKTKPMLAEIPFEGSGDAIWHPGRGLIWGGYGYRTNKDAYEIASNYFNVPVIRLKLNSDRFYHLDTCFAAIDERTVLIHKKSIAPEGVELIHSVFERVIECDDHEANFGMACNATSLLGKHVVIQAGNFKTIAALQNLGYTVHDVDTSEYIKSGGSVFCMKMYLF